MLPSPDHRELTHQHLAWVGVIAVMLLSVWAFWKEADINAVLYALCMWLMLNNAGPLIPTALSAGILIGVCALWVEPLYLVYVAIPATALFTWKLGSNTVRLLALGLVSVALACRSNRVADMDEWWLKMVMFVLHPSLGVALPMAEGAFLLGSPTVDILDAKHLFFKVLRSILFVLVAGGALAPTSPNGTLGRAVLGMLFVVSTFPFSAIVRRNRQNRKEDRST